jgi:flavin reductase (DIM6/NTAB) family NADH-FMN oxidoreductase RutF
MNINYTLNLEKGMKFLHTEGAFLTVKSGDKTNTMTISWGNVGFEWGRPIFTVLVRKSRYTHEFIEQNGEFTVSIPFDKKMKKALAICGTKSGRDIDKEKDGNVKFVDGKSVTVPIVNGCNLYYECKVVYKQDMNPELLDEEIKKGSYAEGDYHTIYYGEIVNIYEK